MIDHEVAANGIRLHYLEHDGAPPPLVLMHGLTANAHYFDALAARLAPAHAILAPDLRGRGQSAQPAQGYTLVDHAADILGMLDALGLERVVLGGHSYGGLLTLHIAARYPERVERIILLDAAIGVTNPQTYELLKPSIERLGRTYPSWESYLALVKAAPYFAPWWDPAIEAYYRADVAALPDGSVRPHTRPETITQVIASSGSEDWPANVAAIRCPALLVRAAGGFGAPGAPPIVSDAQVAATRAALPGLRYAEVPGNHLTMLYGDGAPATAQVITAFLAASG